MTKIAPNRREMLAGAAGLVIGLALPGAARAQSGAAAVIRGEADAVFAPNAFIRVAPDNTVTVLIKHIEFGQGPMTGLATLVAEEMDASWDQMRAEHAPSDPQIYANLAFGIQGTGGSTAIANAYLQMRRAGAAARAMLVAAAAARWGVPAGEIAVAEGILSHPSGKSASFGELAEAAAGQAAPEAPRLKEPSEFRLIGTDRPRLDSRAKSTGTAKFTIDVYREGMLTVAVAHPPKFGAVVASVDETAALAVAGVERVARIGAGVAVYGRNTWAALQGRDALEIDWDESAAETRSTDELARIFAEAARRPATPVEGGGDVDAAFAAAATTHEAEFEFPYLAHAPLEPLDAVIEHRGDSAELWMGSQLQTVDHQVVAGALGLDPAQVRINTMLAGGSFGRRAQPTSHLAAEIGEIARAAGPGAYKLLWTREDDITGGHYRPLTVHRLRGALNAEGRISAWENTIANQSIVAGSPFEMLMQDGVDATSVEGARDMPYAWPAHRVSWARMEAGVPVLWWRSVGHTHTAYATEVFLDELLAKGGQDAVEGRLRLIRGDRPRDRAVLERVAEISGWQGPGRGDRALGVALHKSFGTHVAMIAEVSEADGMPKVHKVWAAVDCGVAVNPNIIRAQVEGGVGYGLSAALHNELTLEEGGRVAQTNFDTYPLLRIPEMPVVEVSIIASAEAPSGIGEPGVPPLAPAVGNAWRVLTGAAKRRLPFAAPERDLGRA
ncbi:xanthine dehydrogenase family protein molybdopterin-binding subunit [Paralimibaculum aggregatum]|uniref:Xanthine dehydrogenase family protein molybdopterin-binding subunit n=1 Tax=Paralimibaculum aggregatum TaxID=3036245 RepID=A0ABQ6LN18_9RHOB|nr:molybdopterin cofactor-binding domain-containing protein [Limibaculum sp. NKW23]GMG84602.1 xanthine dehydrogenase family protein molybdopterin-binding subunit [Limibaculum sp. NKW23]